ncbi:GTPase ObgE [bacterium (Candidatus Howlettbacteria) CG23_combo_of_CG06-09_8_20_14_all_37_9]|nr:MAG: GTPase ObgE [bacterium (Candidatus Howlettbacteria) CG23_combo_of_CG06-09_8_20_14_all_37_9]
MFADEVVIKIKAGDGGNGIVSWERQKYVAKGGPGGGDGGDGGDVIFRANKDIATLSFYTTNKYLKAESGQAGRSHKKTGKGGEDLVLEVPVGTIVIDIVTKEILADLIEDKAEVPVVVGGEGGFGNAHFTSSVRQAPEISELGEPGEEKEIKLELKLVADVGLVGLPNIGKSTLLSVVTKARPKIADYPFTTIIPNLGVVDRLPDGKVPDNFGFVIADIPGLIKGAALGKGLGDEFLRHIERTRVIVHLIDAVSSSFSKDYLTINEELKSFNPDILLKPSIIAISRADLLSADELQKKIKEFTKEAKIKDKIYTFSGVTRQGLNDLLFKINDLLIKNPRKFETKVEEFKKFTLKDRVSGFDVIKEKNYYIISGPKIDKFAIRTDFDMKAPMYRFRHILKRLGVENELRKQGARDGDKIKVAGKEFEFQED